MVIIPLNFARCTLPTNRNRLMKSSLYFCSSLYLITVRGSVNERYVVHWWFYTNWGNSMRLLHVYKLNAAWMFTLSLQSNVRTLSLWNKLSNPLWDYLQYKINGARKAPSQHILIWYTVPYGLKIINAMFPVFQKIFWDTLYKMNLFNYMQACIFSRLKLLFNFYAKRTIRRKDFGAKFNLTYHNVCRGHP